MNKELDNFMKKFKYYKSNKPKPSLDQVIAPQNKNYYGEVSSINNNIIKEDVRAEMLGLTSLKNWKAYTFHKHPGLIFIRNPFTSMGQRYWIQKCLKDYPRKPNKTNLDIDYSLNDWWAECHKNNECDIKLQKKLRWTTLGYHHNWDTKVYSEENKTTFPEDLAELCDIFAQYLGYTAFKAEAAIVNYYHMGSTLSAHTDHSEVNLEAPLYSFSFGQSAIFLLGGHVKLEEPSAILLDSGDVIVMSKEARLCYHAVPKILPASSQPWDFREIEKLKNTTVYNGANFKHLHTETDMNKITNEMWTHFDSYINESRVNINVRQVLKDNQESLNDVDNI